MFEPAESLTCGLERTTDSKKQNCETVAAVHALHYCFEGLHIRAQRTSNWQLHLSTARRMLNLFAAAGHMNYARCGRLYLQLMTDLPQTQTRLHEQFMSVLGVLSDSGLPYQLT